MSYVIFREPDSKFFYFDELTGKDWVDDLEDATIYPKDQAILLACDLEAVPKKVSVVRSVLLCNEK